MSQQTRAEVERGREQAASRRALLRGRRGWTVVLATALLVACVMGFMLALRARRAAARPPILLAVTLTLSGLNASDNTKSSLRGLQLYLDDVNHAGGVNGRALRLQVYDDRGDPAT